MREKLVYIAGPISKGCIHHNIRQAAEASIALLKAKVPNICPHMTCFSGAVRDEAGKYTAEVLPSGTVHADWYGMDTIIVQHCDAVLRLPGESTGADIEVAEAQRLGKPVFTNVDDVIAWAQGT